MTVPIWLNSSTGRRPRRSDRPPMKGPAMNCAAKKRRQKQGDDFRRHVEFGLGIKRQDGIDHGRADHLYEDNQQYGDEAAIKYPVFWHQAGVTSL